MFRMWQEEYGKPYYRFQTDEKHLTDKMKRRQNFKLVGWGVNYQEWWFVAIISRPSTAKKIFKTLSKEKPILNKKDDIFYPASYYSKSKN